MSDLLKPKRDLFISQCFSNVSIKNDISTNYFKDRWTPNKTKKESSYCLKNLIELALEEDKNKTLSKLYTDLEKPIETFIEDIITFITDPKNNTEKLLTYEEIFNEIQNFCGKEKNTQTAGICYKALKKSCVKFNRDQLDTFPFSLGDFCACHSPGINLTESARKQIDTDTFNIINSTECYDRCLNTSTIKLPDLKSGDTVLPYPLKTCQRSVCIMSNINVSADDAKNVNFSQNCSSCVDECLCIFKDNTITDLKNNIKIVLKDSNYYCGDKSVYFSGSELVGKAEIGPDITDPNNVKEKKDNYILDSMIFKICGGIIIGLIFLYFVYKIIKR